MVVPDAKIASTHAQSYRINDSMVIVPGDAEEGSAGDVAGASNDSAGAASKGIASSAAGVSSTSSLVCGRTVGRGPAGASGSPACAAMVPRIMLAAGASVSTDAAVVLGETIGVRMTSSVSPFRMGLVKSALTPLTRMAKVTRVVAGGGVNPTASSASLTLALPVPF